MCETEHIFSNIPQSGTDNSFFGTRKIRERENREKKWRKCVCKQKIIEKTRLGQHEWRSFWAFLPHYHTRPTPDNTHAHTYTLAYPQKM